MANKYMKNGQHHCHPKKKKKCNQDYSDVSPPPIKMAKSQNIESNAGEDVGKQGHLMNWCHVNELVSVQM